MGQILVRNVSDKALDTLKLRARMKGTSLEQEVRELIDASAPYTPEERVAAAREVQGHDEGDCAVPLNLHLPYCGIILFKTIILSRQP